MQEVATLNNRPAPYRRDLRGADLVCELMLVMDRIKPGDTLRIHRGAILAAGASLEHVLPPVYPHERWVDDETHELCVRRLR
jgi:hypothetical protein